MALRAQIRNNAAWVDFFTKAGIPATEAADYATKFTTNRINELTVTELDNKTLIDIGVDILGDRLAILQYTKHSFNSTTLPPGVKPTASATAKAPILNGEMTHAQFRKFKVDWGVYKQLTSLPLGQLSSSLYNACSNSVQNLSTHFVMDSH